MPKHPSLTFKQSGLPDKGKIRAAFKLAASNYSIYTNEYHFENVLKQTQALHRHCPGLPENFLASVLLNKIIFKESLPGSHPKRHLALSEANFVRDFGRDIVEKTVAASHVWDIPATNAAGFIWKNETELKTLDPDLQKVLMADMIARMEQIVAGHVPVYGHPKPNYNSHIKLMDRYTDTFKAVAGTAPAMDRNFEDLMPKARAAVESFRP